MRGSFFHGRSGLWLVLATLLALLLLVLSETAAAETQYRQSDLDFLKSMAARVDDVEDKLDEWAGRQSRASVEPQASVGKQAMPEKAAANRAEPAPGGARVSERLRHKQRAVTQDPEAAGRIKVKLPALREEIESTRLRISEQARLIRSGIGRQQANEKTLAETQRRVEALEYRLEQAVAGEG